MLDNLNPAARSAVVLCLLSPLVAFVGAFTAAVLTSRGVTGVDWEATLTDALNSAGVVLATGIGTFTALWVTPLTRRYGIGSEE